MIKEKIFLKCQKCIVASHLNKGVAIFFLPKESLVQLKWPKFYVNSQFRNKAAFPVDKQMWCRLQIDGQTDDHERHVLRKP